MKQFTLTYPTPEGSQTISIDGERMSFGRGNESDHRFADDGLSRLHAVIYRDGERIWIVDENSTNGTFVNGERAAATGTPLRDGDRIKIGDHTLLTVNVLEPKTARAEPRPSNVVSSAEPAGKFSMVPVIVIAAAIMVISISVVLIAFAVMSPGPEIASNRDVDTFPDEGPRPSPTAKPNGSPSSSPVVSDNSNTGANDLPVGNSNITPVNVPSGKKYAEMSDAERRQYLEAKAMRIAQVIGNSGSEAIPAAAIDKIKGFTDAYASRAKVKPLGGCRFGDNLQATFERASKNAPFVVRAFNEKGIDPRIGLYLAMIESEHCICLQSPTGPLGMFQFTKATAEIHGLKVFSGASPSNPDERCQPEPAARAAASYMKALTGRYGTGPASVPLAIGSYNSGEGGLSSNLQKALDSNSGLPRDFWTLIANGDKLSKQFQAENFKYVPKFFAAAIIGENPQDFGLNLQPVSTYTK
ncbi:MAG TPA: FHA domain-containing protein [Pyrinomonadaceae bacterium]|nr:FHA domain-containing protein [Chloracidobacterium sp.]MBP9935474.1 FHA domain-containing protein [Pyrinomonadaceae bacterium]MBK7801912.1 FHA domain-containing protein [Chloracidobacterium sp.]MBK9765626.1 FHA domain-containing protein [Chloracidobacterium sp.]MBL0242216.1 FHA domain-containing protein [Chloracidobacterium sp.]